MDTLINWSPLLFIIALILGIIDKIIKKHKEKNDNK
jgi:F0F1-type ATP synthase assembly protein I